MNNVIFDNINLLYIFIPLALIVIIPFFIVLKKKSFKWYNLFSLLSHLLICGFLSTSLAGVKTQEIKTESMVYIVADVSNTTKNVVDEMDEYIKEFKEKLSVSSTLGVVSFAKEAKEIVKPGSSLVSLKDVEMDDSSTNYENALTYTASLFSKEYKKRIVLLSDGKETDGDVLTVKEQLIAEGIRIDAVYFDSNLKDSEKEVLINDIKSSSSTFLNNDEDLTLVIKSNYDAAISINILDNDALFYNANHVVKKGNNEILIKANTSSVGMHSYKVTIDEKNDVTKENNTFYFIQEIHEKCEVLVISSSYDDATFIESSLSDNCNVDKMMTYNDISNDIKQYIKYDEIILSDVDINAINNSSAFVDTLELLVTKYGKSLITFGGKHTYLDGGFLNSKLKDMLPVDVNPTDTKKKTALILIIDNSGSMAGERLQMAKKGAKSCLEILDVQDYIGVISFESITRVVQPLASVVFKDRIAKRIDTIVEGDGTMMSPGLKEAYEEMKLIEGQMSNRQVILISDGMPGDAGQQDIVRQMADDGIVVSTIAIGNQGSSLLSDLANLGNGNYYRISGAAQLPNVMLGEVSDMVMDSIIEENVKVNINLPNNPIVKHISNFPNIDGFNYSKSKYNTTTVLSTTHTLENGDTINDVPIFTYWNYGQGKISTFMSDISFGWSKDFFKSEDGKILLNQIIKENLPKNHHDSYMFVDVINNGLTSKLNVEVPTISSRVEVKAEITSPSGKKIKKDLTLNNGVYTQDFETIEKGIYNVHIDYVNKSNSSVIKYDDKFTYSYSKEYDLFVPSDNIILYQLVDKNGVVSNNVDDIVNIEQEDIIYTKYYSMYLLLASIILFVLDIIIRKIRLKDIKNLFKKTIS